jgi:Cdc6-like AAA superfamily ATPase
MFPVETKPLIDRGSPRPARGQLFPRFRSTAGDQLDPRQSDRFASVRLRLRSAYTPSQPVSDRRMFAGRTEILTTMIRSIEDERLHTIVYGERGIGKTSMLQVLMQAAREARYLVAYVPCSAGSTFDEIFRAVAADVPLQFHSRYGPTSPEAERRMTFADLIPAVPVTIRFASDLCARVVGTRVLIVLDEFDRCESVEFRRNIAEFLKNLSDRSVRVQLVIAGVAANLTELLDQVPKMQRNILALPVPKMKNEEIRQLVQNGELVSGLTFDGAAADLIVAVANGLPYIASLLSHHAGLAALDEGRLVVSAGDAAAAVVESLGELNGRISRRSQARIIAAVRDRSLKLLGPIAGLAQTGGGQFDAQDIDGVFDEKVLAAQARALLASLVADGALIELHEDEIGVHYRFVEETVAPYLWLLAAQARFMESEKKAPIPVEAAAGGASAN